MDAKRRAEYDLLGDLKFKGQSRTTLLNSSMGSAAEQTATSGGGSSLKKQTKPAYLQSLNESEKQANFRIIEKMNKKISFLKNPRYKKNMAPITMTEAMKNKAGLEPQSMKITSFRVEPPVLNFIDY